ncbi:molybdenum cofactor biosynthesis protein MoaE [Acidobacteria bacterium AH-259-O06]|nr:molybdenum cofactor biosynthesis protein MoaE [Acidobacteria bacterium AH-259-L09]MDA2929508.1 molybdenum cofactor biosynthesis protein MoaE [Acidobacteria bacterium AH-259-O06]
MIQIVEGKINREEIVKSVSTAQSGAIVTFDGTVRNHARGKRVTHLYYEAFPEMATRELEKIRTQAIRRWTLNGMAIVHRIGRMEIGESSVFIVVSAAHRGDAFEACEFAIDTLKTTVPIWKKEHYQDGEVWIEGCGQ